MTASSTRPTPRSSSEYLGTNPAAEALTAANADERTTAAGDDCGDHGLDTSDIAGGNRAAYLLAFENAVNAQTHSVISGKAPAGATLTLERSGVFPLWDGSLFGDSVATSMVVGDKGKFDWHVNPSTRPFVASRKAPVLGEPVETLSTSGVLPPMQSTSETFEVTESTDLVRATVRTTVPVDGQAVSYAQFHLELVAPDGSVVATAEEFGPINSLSWTGPEGRGIPSGTYTINVSNSIGFTSAYDLEAATQNVLDDHTPRRFEAWTLTCTTADGIAGQASVLVDRGEQVDLGKVCDQRGRRGRS